MRIVAYTYKADLYCPDCLFEAMFGVDRLDDSNTEAVLDSKADALNIDRDDESTFDSGSFPKVVFKDQVDKKDKCGSCGVDLK